jgi:hypothetical protein
MRCGAGRENILRPVRGLRRPVAKGELAGPRPQRHWVLVGRVHGRARAVGPAGHAWVPVVGVARVTWRTEGPSERVWGTSRDLTVRCRDKCWGHSHRPHRLFRARNRILRPKDSTGRPAGRPSVVALPSPNGTYEEQAVTFHSRNSIRSWQLDQAVGGRRQLNSGTELAAVVD